MKSEEILMALGDVNERYIEESAPKKKKTRSHISFPRQKMTERSTFGNSTLLQGDSEISTEL